MLRQRLKSLVLNSTFEALNTVSAYRALQLVKAEKAQLLHSYDIVWRSPSSQFVMPSVIVLRKYVNRNRKLPKSVIFNKSRVLHRDGYRCAYCGSAPEDISILTLDHVVPRSKGGQTCYENVVTACAACNQQKADRTPEQARMKLRRKPEVPRTNAFFFQKRGSPKSARKVPESWHQFLNV